MRCRCVHAMQGYWSELVDRKCEYVCACSSSGTNASGGGPPALRREREALSGDVCGGGEAGPIFQSASEVGSRLDAAALRRGGVAGRSVERAGASFSGCACGSVAAGSSSRRRTDRCVRRGGGGGLGVCASVERRLRYFFSGGLARARRNASTLSGAGEDEDGCGSGSRSGSGDGEGEESMRRGRCVRFGASLSDWDMARAGKRLARSRAATRLCSCPPQRWGTCPRRSRRRTRTTRPCRPRRGRTCSASTRVRRARVCVCVCVLRRLVAAGRGPVLGPLVYGVAYCPVAWKAELEQLGFAGASCAWRRGGSAA
jgi:hypothetical protein